MIGVPILLELIIEIRLYFQTGILEIIILY